MADLITLQTGFVVYRPLANGFSAPQLYRQVLLRARISYGNSVCCPSVRHDPVRIQCQVRQRLRVFTI